MTISPTIQNSGGAAPNLEDVRRLADLVTGANSEIRTALSTLTADEHGKTIILNNATGFVTTLPAVADGLKFRFLMGATALSSGNHTIVPLDGDNIIEGSISSPEVTALVAVVAAANTVSFINALAVIGDWCEFWCDGTTWYLSGCTFVQDGMTSTQP